MSCEDGGEGDPSGDNVDGITIAMAASFVHGNSGKNSLGDGVKGAPHGDSVESALVVTESWLLSVTTTARFLLKVIK